MTVHQLLGGIPVGSQSECFESLRRITEGRGSRCHRKSSDLLSCRADEDIFAVTQPNRSRLYVYYKLPRVTPKVKWYMESSVMWAPQNVPFFSSHGPERPQFIQLEDFEERDMWWRKLYLLVLLDLALLKHGEHVGGSTLTLLLPPLGLLGCLWEDER